MSNAAKSILVHGIYLLGLGVVMLTIPNVPLKIFGLPETNEVWIRVVGMMSLVLGYYFVQSARKELTDFFRSTLLTRSAAIVFFILFVVLGLAPINLLLLIAVDPVFIIWTALALRSSEGVKTGLVHESA
ncbi:MAG: hypothetical protein ABI690_15790 [Chloroflexota bacterium]